MAIRGFYFGMVFVSLAIVLDFVQCIKNNQVHEGFQECMQACGKLLAEHYPATSD